MALTDTAIRKIKPTEKSFKITDSSGPYLLIKPNGSKLWYMKYRIDEEEAGFWPLCGEKTVNQVEPCAKSGW